MCGAAGAVNLPPLREVIARHGLAASKALGQNFLLDEQLLGRIAAIPGDLGGQQVLEVGPGPGGLTRALLRAGANVTAIEMDRRCLPALAELDDAFPGQLHVIEGDALKVPHGIAGPFHVVANLPYNAGTALFVPTVEAAHSTARVLTTDRVDGRRLTEALDGADRAERTRLLRALCDGIARQIFRGGVVHADPHPGNFLCTADGRIAVLDWGCVLRLSADERRGYARLMLALAGGDGATAERELRGLGFGGDGPALADIAASITAVMRPGVSAAAVDWEAQGQAFVADVTVRAKAAAVTVPRSFVLLGRVLGTLAGLVAVYKPDLELAQIIGPHLAAALAA